MVVCAARRSFRCVYFLLFGFVMSSLDSLTSAQRGQLVHFQAVVNLPDAEHALSILRNHNWSMEDAVANALIMSPSTATPAPPSSSLPSSHPVAPSLPPPLNTSSASLSSSNYAAVSPASSPTRSLLSSSSPSASSSASSAATTPSRAARAPASLGWYEWINSYPFGWLVTSTLTFCSQLLAAVLPSTLWHGPVAAPPTARHVASSSTSSTLVTGWLQRWPHSPPFVTQSYLTAVRECKAHHKLLFLYLHHPDVRTGDGSFVATTLCSEAMHNFVEQNFVAWMGSAQTGDGARLASTLRVRSYPFVALLAPVNNQLAVMYRREGETTASSSGGNEVDEMIHAMLLKMEQYEAMTATERRKEEERREGRTLRDQQDREYQEALEKDREQQRKKEREAEAKRKAEEEREARVRAAEEERRREERRKQDRLARKQRLLDSLPPEPTAGGAAVVTVSVRMADGKKISRRWEDSTAMDRLFDWIDAQPQQAAQAGDADVVRGEAAGGVRVVSNFPRKVHTDGSVTVKSLGLGKQILLMVEPVETETDETQQ